jgi:hypothetical protein
MQTGHSLFTRDLGETLGCLLTVHPNHQANANMTPHETVTCIKARLPVRGFRWMCDDNPLTYVVG